MTHGRISSGKTIFFTKLGLSVINKGALLKHSVKMFKIIRPANKIKVNSLVSPEKPQRVLRITENTRV